MTWRVRNEEQYIAEYQLVRPDETVLYTMTLAPHCMFEYCPSFGQEITGPCIERFRVFRDGIPGDWSLTGSFPYGIPGPKEPWLAGTGDFYFRIIRKPFIRRY